MKASQQEVIKAILFLADQYDLKAYKELIKGTQGLSFLIKELAYDLFILRFNPYDCNEESFKAYTLIIHYAEELKQYGFVKFETE